MYDVTNGDKYLTPPVFGPGQVAEIPAERPDGPSAASPAQWPPAWLQGWAKTEDSART